MRNLRSLLWDADALAANASARDPDFGITARAASRRVPFRLLRYWFVERLLREEALRHGRPLRVLEAGVHRGQMKAFVDGARPLEGHDPYAAWDAIDCALDAPRLLGLGYGRLHAADLDDGPSLDGLPAALAPQGYDAVIALHVLEHLREPERALAGLAALVRPGGVVLGGFPVLPAWLAPLRENRLRRTAKPFGHVSAFSPPRLERMALAAGLAVDFRAGAFGLRASGSALEDSEAWLRANLLFGAAFPGWPGEIYWRLRKLAPAAAPAKSPALGRASRETAAEAVST